MDTRIGVGGAAGDGYGCNAWGGRGWHQEQAYGYDTGFDDASRGSRRPRSPSGRPRRPRDSGPDGSHSDGRGGSRRRRLSSFDVGGGSSAFACDLRLGLRGGVIDVDDGFLVGLHDSRGFPRSAMVTLGEWFRRYQLTADEGGPVADTGAPPRGLLAPLVDGRPSDGLLPSGPPVLPAAGGSPLLAITLPDWGVPPGPPIPIPWAKWEGRHGEVLDTDVPSDCASDGGVTGTESCDTSYTAVARSPRGGDGTASRPYFGPGALMLTRPRRRSTRLGWLAATLSTLSGPRAFVMGGQRMRSSGLRPRSRRLVPGNGRRTGSASLRGLPGGSTLLPSRRPLRKPACPLGLRTSCSLASLGSPFPLCSSGPSPGARATSPLRTPPRVLSRGRVVLNASASWVSVTRMPPLRPRRPAARGSVAVSPSPMGRWPVTRPLPACGSRTSRLATVLSRARGQLLLATRARRTMMMVPASARGGPLSTALPTWFTPAPTGATTVLGPFGPALVRGRESRCASSSGLPIRLSTR